MCVALSLYKFGVVLNIDICTDEWRTIMMRKTTKELNDDVDGSGGGGDGLDNDENEGDLHDLYFSNSH